MTETVKRTQDELVAELRARFGDDKRNWAFICPACGDVATLGDIQDALFAAHRDENHLLYVGRQCIGRILGALEKGNYDGRGCDWAAFGLFRGPEFVIKPDGREMPSFAIAPAPAGALS